MQERAVIATYRSQLDRFVDAINARWRVFDAEPDAYGVTAELRRLRAKLQKALESYYAAVGARESADIQHVLTTIDTTDTRLAHIDQELLAEVDRFQQAAFDIAARFHAAKTPAHKLNVCADADDALIELELYHHGWSTIMHSSTRTRLHQAKQTLRAVVDSSPDANTRSLPPPTAHPNAHHPHPGPSHVSDSAPSDPNGIQSHASPPNGFDAMPLRSPRNPSHSSDSERRRRNDPTYVVRQPSESENGTMVFESVVVSPSSPRKKRPLRQGSRTTDENDCGESSESGDEAAMLMVMSRTRTLRDMAENAMNLGDELPDPGDATMEHVTYEQGFGQRDRVSPNEPFPPSRMRELDRSSGQTHVEQPNLSVARNASFASTLYRTRNARVNSISDAGVMLKRSNVRGDGRCLFRAVARGRVVARGESLASERAEKEEADMLRSRAVAELQKHRELLARFFVIEGNFDQYLRKMSHSRAYGGEPELLMLAKLLHVPIAVYIDKNGSYRQIQVYGKQYRGNPLRILYSDGVHYDALLAHR